MTKKPEQLDIEEKAAEKSAPSSPTREEELLAIMDQIIGAYKKLIVHDEPETQKLLREMTKVFITAGSIVRLLNRRKQVKPSTTAV